MSWGSCYLFGAQSLKVGQRTNTKHKVCQSEILWYGKDGI